MGTYPSPFSLRVPEELKEKVRHIAAENKRSINKEMELAIEQYVRAFEKKNGVIDL